MNEDTHAGAQGSPAAPDPAPVSVFINYRRSESAGDARALYDRLGARFGKANVFLDVETLQPGTKWLESIKQRATVCGVLVALIGPRWVSIMKERGRLRLIDPEVDYVRLELEAALRKGSGVHVIPVLIDDAVMPSADKSPPPLRPLASYHAASLRHSRWEADVDQLIERIEEIGLEITHRRPAPEPVVRAKPAALAEPLAEPVAPPPQRSHYQSVAKFMLSDGSVAPFLGPGINAGDRDEPWQDGWGLPDAQELSQHLADVFNLEAQHATDLARVSQYVFLTTGKSDLYRTLRRVLTGDYRPTSVHRFLARVPTTLQNLGVVNRYQLIVTTNYDDALERAFDDEEEPYDIAVYMAGGEQQEHKGKFVHLPFEGEAGPILVPNKYVDFPIDEDGNLERTVIVKINGAVDRAGEPYPWKENYVITEDQFIDYLSRSPVESLVPLQLLNKMRESHFLFLGYTMRDWNLRVFLQRIWGEQKLGAKSWAIQRDPVMFEKERWNDFGVDLFASPLADYISELDNHLAQVEAAPSSR